MKIDLLDIDKLIDLNKLNEITSTNIYATKLEFDEDGIMSNKIFGISRGDRVSTFGYVDLHRKFIHPHIYSKVLKAIFRNVMYIMSGQKKFSVDNGKLVKDDNGWTGIDNLYKNWDMINWETVDSRSTDSIKLLKDTPKDSIFIDKFIVCPPAYRDILLSGTVDSSDHMNVLNGMYQKLLRTVALLQQGGIFSYMQYTTQNKVQDILVEIYEHFKSMIARKHGLIRQSLMGKAVDYGTRSVISAHNYNVDKIEDSMVSLDRSAVPISQCCSTFYPFIESWLVNFFNRDIINNPGMMTFIDSNGNSVQGTIYDADVMFSQKNIKKLINSYLFNPDGRFSLIKPKVQTQDGSIQELGIKLVGKVILDNDVSKTIDRPMTVTDLLYMACVECCEKRHLMTSRYPIGTDKCLFFTKIIVKSTINTVKVVYNGKEYPYWPDINLDSPHNIIGKQFVDTLVFSNSHLKGCGGDFDGDQAYSKGIWSEEANAEAEKLMNSKMSVLNISGNNSKVIGSELVNTMFELTRIGPNQKPVPDSYVKQYLDMKVSDLSVSFMTKMFSNKASKGDNGAIKETKSLHNTWDTITVPANHFFEGQKEIKTTIGRYVFNKFIFHGSGMIAKTGFFDDTIDGDYVGKIDDMIADLYLNDEINKDQFNRFVDRRDFLGLTLHGMLAHSISITMLKPLKSVIDYKKKLFKQYEKELADGDIVVMTKVAEDLVEFAKKELKDDPGMNLYLCGDLNFANNYKNNSILKGAVMNKTTNRFDFIETSFMEGINPKDVPIHSNSILSSQYPTSIATRESGYLGKKLLALLQSSRVDNNDSDCGTKRLIPITITKNNAKHLSYIYIKTGSGLTLLTPQNVSDYIGQTVMMRSPMSCIQHDSICNKCAGELFKKQEIIDAGLYVVQLSFAALNLALKAKHDATIKLYTQDPETMVVDL